VSRLVDGINVELVMHSYKLLIKPSNNICIAVRFRSMSVT